jgi:hypothetical protein
VSFQILKPALIPPRGLNLIKPVETLNMAMNLITRTVGDHMQSAVRLGELVTLGVLAFDEAGDIVAGGNEAWTKTTKVYQNDFSSAAGTRAYFQSSVLNGPTNLSVAPNGTSAIGLFSAFGGSDMANAQNVQFGMNTGVAVVNVTKTGSATAPTVLAFQFDTTEWAQLSNLGVLTVRGPVASRVTNAAYGYTQLNPGGSGGQPGFISWHKPDATRVGYMGWTTSANTIDLKMEAGFGLIVTGATTFASETAVNNIFRVKGGALAACFIHDRTTDRDWAWYGTADVFRLFNGTSDITTISPAGAWVSASFTPCDERAKTVHGLVAPREDLADQLVLYDFTRDTGLQGRGPMAQAVQLYAPEYVLEVDDRLAVDQVGLVTEALAGLAARVRRLESQHGSPC